MKKFVAIFLVSSLLFSACVEKGPDQKDQDGQKEVSYQEKEAAETRDIKTGSFAKWVEDEISYTPSIEPYQVQLDFEDLTAGNVVAYENFYPDKNTAANLNQFGFSVANDNRYQEFFVVYEDNRYEFVPSFITTDSVLHTYHLFFNYLLESLEKEELYDTAVALSDTMYEITEQQYRDLEDTEFKYAAFRNAAYFSVARKMLDQDSEIADCLISDVDNELELIKAHQGIFASNIFGDEFEYLEDYSQYLPRGHYNKNEKLKKYFNTLMWYGRMTFRLKEKDETRSALLIISALKDNQEAFANWEKLYEPINFFVGEPDDPGYYEYITIAKEVYGEDFTQEDIINNEAKLDEFISEAKKLASPKINSMPVLDPAYVPNDRETEIEGFRFMGQRSTVDAMIFQKLIYREVQKNPQEEVRMLPMGLDIPAVFGSSHAYKILEDLNQTEFENWKENFEKMQNFLVEMPQDNWTKNIYWGWMNTLRTLIEDYPEGFPSFMTNDAWKKKELVTFLASWTELKHDTILYAKQVYAELGGAPMPEDADDRGYVEPNPELYNKLKSLINLTIDGLDERDILDDHNKEQLEKLEAIVTQLRDISIKELENTPLTDEEYEFIKTYGGSLEHFWLETLSEEDKDKDPQSVLNSNPAAIVADVATDPNCCVLEEATGNINTIYVVFPIDGELHVARGGVFSHYEFSWPMDDRLTDEKWRTILFPWTDPEYDYTEEDESKKPDIAEWQKEFTTEY